MNTLKLSLAAVAAALVFGAAAPARANDVADGTYTFTSTDGNTTLDGSWIQLTDDNGIAKIASWDLVDSAALSENGWLSNFSGYGFPALFPPLTPSNSSVIDVLAYDSGTGPNPFSFAIGSPTGTTSTDSSVFYFSGQNSLNGFSALYDGATFNTVPVVVNINDPIGNWVLSSSSPVPDAPSTIELFLGALTALGTCKAFLRGRSAARR